MSICFFEFLHNFSYEHPILDVFLAIMFILFFFWTIDALSKQSPLGYIAYTFFIIIIISIFTFYYISHSNIKSEQMSNLGGINKIVAIQYMNNSKNNSNPLTIGKLASLELQYKKKAGTY